MADENRFWTRRKALTLLAGGALGAGGAYWGLTRAKLLAFLEEDAADDDPVQVMRRPFGAERRMISVLGYGGVRLPLVNHDKGHIDRELGGKLVDFAWRHGVNVFDTGYIYHKGDSERFYGDVLAKYPRDEVFLMDKMPTWNVKTADDPKKLFEEQLARCRVTYFDNYLLHSIGSPETFKRVYEDLGTLTYLLEEKKRGRIRHLGFSYHGKLDFLKTLTDRYDCFESAILMINGVEAERNKETLPLLARMVEKKIPVFVMEPLGGGHVGRLNAKAKALLAAKDPASSVARWAFRWVAGHPGVICTLSGMNRRAHILENAHTFSEQEFRALTDEENATYAAAMKEYLRYPTIPCTGCRYCTPCPYGVAIPEVFAWWNSFSGSNRLPSDEGANDSQALRREFLASYDRSIPPQGRADHCIQCRKCTASCPQWIFDIPGEMQKIDVFVEKTRVTYAARKRGGGLRRVGG